MSCHGVSCHVRTSRERSETCPTNVPDEPAPPFVKFYYIKLQDISGCVWTERGGGVAVGHLRIVACALGGATGLARPRRGASVPSRPPRIAVASLSCDMFLFLVTAVSLSAAPYRGGVSSPPPRHGRVSVSAASDRGGVTAARHVFSPSRPYVGVGVGRLRSTRRASRHPPERCNAMTFHAMSFHAISCHAMSCHGMAWHGMSRHVTACQVRSGHAISCHAMSCHGMSCHVVSCRVVVVSCYAISCYVMACL